ncbi:MAG: hypothetical protein WAO57_08660 [Syntrophomonadaceae bacterium]|jgi:hypothetical protein
MHTPELPNYYAVIWTLVNFLLLLVPIVLIIGLVWYVKQKQAFQKTLLEKMDHLINILEKDTVK